MEETQAKFEGWAVLELFGHQREAGFVTTEYFGGSAMFRVDIPEFPEREYVLDSPEWVGRTLAPKGTTVKRHEIPGRTRYIGPAAVYAMNPCSEEAVRKVCEGLVRRTISIVELPSGYQLKAACDIPEYYDEDDGGDGAEEN